VKSRKTANGGTGLHPWVTLTQGSLENAKPSLHDPLVCPGPNRLNVLVSRAAISRSMLIWDRLLKAVEDGGFKVRMES
jgi:hypothetical protein